MAQNLNPQISQIDPKKDLKNKGKLPDEKLKFLKREEINTMQKDIGKLREAEAKEERTRISQIKAIEEIKKEKNAPPPQLEDFSIATKSEQKQPEAKPEPKPEIITEQISPIIPEIVKTAPIIKEPAISPEIEKLAEEKRRIERDLSWLPEEKIPLEKTLKQLQNEIENIQSTELGPVLREEKQIEEAKKLIEEQERQASFQERQTVESKRWEIERQRKEIEEKKWQIESKIEEKDQNIKKIKLKLSEITNKENDLAGNIQKIAEKAEGAGLQEERINLQQRLSDISAKLKQLEADSQNTALQKQEAEKILNEILSSEKALEEEISILEAKEAKAASLAEQKDIEQKRWETDAIRKKTEEEKWQQQTQNKAIEKIYSDVSLSLQKQKEEKISIESKIRDIDAFLEKTGIRPIEVAVPEPVLKPEIKIQDKATIAPPPPPPPLFTPEQKIPIQKKEIEQIPPSNIKRILIRSGILIIILIAVGSAAWFFVIKDKINPAPAPTPSPSVEPSPTETPEITPAPSLIPITKIKNLNVETYSELQNTFFDNILQPTNGQEEFSRVLIKNTIKNEFLGVKEFFEAFEINAPDGFYDKVDNNFTLFTYASSGEARLGFVIKIKNGNKEVLSNLIKNWEKTMQNSFSQLFAKGMKKDRPAISNIFKNAYFKKQVFRYQTFATNDFGICYGIVNDYLVLTTSGKSMLKVIDLIQKQN